jgi:hypothetical protein
MGTRYGFVPAVVVLLVLAAPAFADRSGGDSAGCVKCGGGYVPELQYAVVYCEEPPSGSSGYSECNIDCSENTAGDTGACRCAEAGDWCYYIVVTP